MTILNRTCLVSLCLGVSVLAGMGAASAKQFRLKEDPLIKRSPEFKGGTLFAPSREKTRALREAKEFLKKERFIDGLRILQKLIDSESDAFYFDSEQKQNRFISLKAESMRQIEMLPKRGREIYELKYGAKAKQTLSDAIGKGDFAAVETITRRFFHTEAGYRATYLLAIYERDHGRPLKAALHFERLRQLKKMDDRQQFEPMLSLQAAVCWGQAGLPKTAGDVLMELKDFLKGAPVEVGGRRVAVFNKRDDALKWLATTIGNKQGFGGGSTRNWRMFRGSGDRIATSAPASPVWDANWTIDAVLDHDTERSATRRASDELHSFSERRREEGMLMQPAGHPLLVNGVAYFKTLQNLWAVNMQTGAVVWKSDVYDLAYRQVTGLASAPRIRRSTSLSSMTRLQTFLDQRVWRDMNAGTISSDGDLVFSINNLDFYDKAVRYSGTSSRYTYALSATNTLTAFSARTGRRVFQLGDEASKRQMLADHFFLGAPLPVGDRLYVLADYRGEIRLVALQLQKRRWYDGSLACTPQVIWTQALIAPEEGVNRFPLRRMAGLTPSFAGGVLLCPTTSGAVVAVDPTRRQLLWGYRYVVNTESNATSGSSFRSYGLPTNPYDAESRWLDTAVTVAEGRIFLTPRDSNELHCLDMDGNLIWKQPRGQRLYVAGVHKDQLILAGRTQIESIRIQDGTPAWKRPTPLPMPAGRGFQTGDIYHIPLETKEIASIDLKTGRVLANARLRSELMPGNLVSANGMLISQTTTGLIGFRNFNALQADIAARLKANRQDPTALEMRGEIRLRQGNEADGLADLRASGKGQSRAKALLASNLMDKLRLDFTGFRKHRAELEALLADEQRGRYHRLLADGLYEAGEYDDALQQYLKLAGPFAGNWKTERTGDVKLRSDRWLQSRVAALFRKAGAADRKKFAAQIEGQLQQAIRYGDPKGLRRFLFAFGHLPGTDGARRKLAEQLSPNENALEMELVLLRLRTSKNSADAAYATAQLARLLALHRRFDSAATFVKDLRTRFAKVDCGGKTGDGVVAELKNSWPQLFKQISWKPTRLVAHSKYSTSRRSLGYRYYATMVGDPGFFEGWSFSFMSSNRQLEARDGNGVVRWTLPFTYSSSYHYYTTKVRAYGHLLVITMADHMMVVNALSRQPAVIWQRSLSRNTSTQTRTRISLQQKRVNGRMVWTAADQSGVPLGMAGYVDDRAIVYQSGRSVIAADPLTGDVLWQLDSADRGSRLSADENHVVIVGPNTSTATIVRAIDGFELATKHVAAGSERHFSRGRFELRWQSSTKARILSWVDVLAGKVIWRKRYSESAIIAECDGAQVAVIEPVKGRLQMMSLEDGKSIIDSPIEADENIEYFFVRNTNDKCVVMTHSVTNRNEKISSVTSLNSYNPQLNGYVYGFDRKTGKRIWTTYVDNQAVELNQPGGLPVMIFAGRRMVAGEQRSVYKLAITILDIRNGRIILAQSRPESSSPYHVSVEPDTQQISVLFYHTSIRLLATKKPLGKPSNQVAVSKDGG